MLGKRKSDKTKKKKTISHAALDQTKIPPVTLYSKRFQKLWEISLGQEKEAEKKRTTEKSESTPVSPRKKEYLRRTSVDTGRLPEKKEDKIPPLSNGKRSSILSIFSHQTSTKKEEISTLSSTALSTLPPMDIIATWEKTTVLTAPTQHFLRRQSDPSLFKPLRKSKKGKTEYSHTKLQKDFLAQLDAEKEAEKKEREKLAEMRESLIARMKKPS